MVVLLVDVGPVMQQAGRHLHMTLTTGIDEGGAAILISTVHHLRVLLDQPLHLHRITTPNSGDVIFAVWPDIAGEREKMKENEYFGPQASLMP